MNEQWIVIPKWDEFQHRDMARSSVPPWIKNLTRLLHDDDYLDLSLSQRGLLHGLWLLYASHRRVLSYDRARTTLAPNTGEARHMANNLEALVQSGWITISASRPARDLASNPASLEVEVEVEVEVEEELNPKAVALRLATAAHPLADEPDIDRTALDQFLETIDLEFREMP